MEFKFTNVLFYSKKNLFKTIMRLSIFLFCAFTFGFTPNSSFSQNAQINIKSDLNLTVDEVFNLIRQQTDYTFVYSTDLFKNASKIELKKGSINTSKLLNKSLDNLNLTYLFLDNKTIVLTKKAVKTAAAGVEELEEIQQKITGTVTDSSNHPLPGVNVLVGKKGNNIVKGVVTDFEGKYTIEGAKGEIIRFSYMGFATQEFVIQNQTIVNVILKEATGKLNEVVLVGYGSQKREEVSSAISSVKAKELTQNIVGVTSFDNALSGLIKGVNISQSTGELGSGVDINIRGITSPFAGADNNPLFVIDGVPVQTNPNIFGSNDNTSYVNTANPLQSINPSDIESIDVLKDAAATAIYGSRGANGVIIVNTKRGTKGEKMSIAVNTSTTFARPIKTHDYLSTDQWKSFNDEFFKYSAQAANENPYIDLFFLSDYSYMANLPIDWWTYTIGYEGPNEDYYGTENTTWADVVFRDPAITNQYNVSVLGGTDKTNYSLSAGYTDQEGLILEENYKQYSFKLGLDSQINKIVKVGATANIGVSNIKSGYRSLNGDLGNELSARPDIAPRDENGDFTRVKSVEYGFFETLQPNPLALMTGSINETKGFTLLGNTYAEFEVVKNLKIKSDVNVALFATDDYSFRPVSIVGTISDLYGETRSSLSTSNVVTTNVVSNLTANYTASINEHDFSVLIGAAWDRNYSDRETFRLEGFPDDEVLTNVTSGELVTSKAGTKYESGLNSLFSRLTYSYDDKYFATANLRTDRSIKFGPENQRAFFPSLALSWKVSNESFLQNNTTLNSLRLRASIGKTGSNNVGDFAYLQFFAPGINSDANYGGNQAIGLTGVLPNEAIKWETTNEMNVGLNFGLFNNRIRGSLDYYNRKTTDALMPSPFPFETGADTYTANFADLTNKGFELDLGGDIIRTDELQWAANFNISQNKNTLDKFNQNGISSFLIDRYEIGREVNIIKGYVVEKIFQDQTELDNLNAGSSTGFYQEYGTGLGDYKYKDLNNDGRITSADREYLGSSQPDVFGGFNTEVNYKGFSLGAYFNYSLGGESLWASYGNKLSYSPNINTYSMFYENTWTPERIDAEYPRFIITDPNFNSRISNKTVYDTSFLRLKTLQFGYQFPQQIIEKFSATGLSIFVTGSNLWTLTDFPGLNPDSKDGGFASVTSTDNRDPYPVAKTWSLGVNLKF
ncbi:TonB-dependent receptor [Gramella jeungdoensis]|uniref:TonB-dependent receptor n=2 Tax=Flavobacteriaceae TaxID=49546 RepID=A0A4Y8AX63_9FLAO|nr:TonB-dependent receptor [Gramella jeungdoensis]